MSLELVRAWQCRGPACRVCGVRQDEAGPLISLRSVEAWPGRTGPRSDAADDLGFRVALSAP